MFQQQIIWEELFQINDMGDNFSRGTFGMEYYCHIFSKYLVFQMKNLVFPSQNLAFWSKTLDFDRNTRYLKSEVLKY